MTQQQLDQLRQMVADSNYIVFFGGAGVSTESGIPDFRMVAGPTHTNLIFDAVVPFAVALDREELRHRIATAVRTLDGGNYFAVVKVEGKYA